MVQGKRLLLSLYVFALIYSKISFS